jgi:hypothetical protein
MKGDGQCESCAPDDDSVRCERPDEIHWMHLSQTPTGVCTWVSIEEDRKRDALAAEAMRRPEDPRAARMEVRTVATALSRPEDEED